ncbi:phosphoglycerate dehydrogenase [Pacificispira sp.]|uniref:phosphoglycerate dehydrogenase n=1 Tax=Pacificispira sp. TaxID=2888761 RepID=UPI003BACDF1B
MSQQEPLPEDIAGSKILLLEGISEKAVRHFETLGFRHVVRETKALQGDDLVAALKDVRILGIRSRSQVDDAILARSEMLRVVGCFSVGTNQIDLDAAQRRGIPVFNAPFSNTRSVAELTIAEAVMLLRRAFARSMAAHAGRWDKSAAGSYELRGKTLGIIGYGNIGTQLAVLAEAMGMRVVYFDHTDKLRHGNVEPMESLDALLATSDIVSLHVPETPQTKDMIGAAEIAKMKKGAYLINNARGTVVDLDALAEALREEHLAGAAVDVFPVEPKSNADSFESPLRGLENVILTPHVGGSTLEAQERIGDEVSRKLSEYANNGSTVGAVNFPQVQLPPRTDVTRFIQVQRNLPGELRKLNDIFADREVNIAAQHYQTKGEIGYVVLDAEGTVDDADAIVAAIKTLPGTLRARVLR